MTDLRCPRCQSTELGVTARLHYHHTIMGRAQRDLHFAVTSEIRCAVCRHHWRTRSFKADGLPDAPLDYRCCAGFRDIDLVEARAWRADRMRRRALSSH